MKRREMLLTVGATAMGFLASPWKQVFAEEKEERGGKKQKVLYFTRSAGFVHPPVDRRGRALSDSEKLLVDWGREAGIEVVCSQDGAVFDGDIDAFDAFVFYTSGDLTGKCATPQPGNPMSPTGKEKLLAAIAAGKGFVGIHSATDTFRSKGIDPYIAMLGAEFTIHGAQQKATQTVISPKFPGIEGLQNSFRLHEEWYAFHKYSRDLHVILLQETEGMKGQPYEKLPPYPATWARMHGRGRVFYTSMGHEHIWANPTFRQVLMGGVAWALRNADADVTPNIEQAAPRALLLK